MLTHKQHNKPRIQSLCKKQTNKQYCSWAPLTIKNVKVFDRNSLHQCHAGSLMQLPITTLRRPCKKQGVGTPIRAERKLASGAIDPKPTSKRTAPPMHTALVSANDLWLPPDTYRLRIRQGTLHIQYGPDSLFRGCTNCASTDKRLALQLH